MEIMFVKTTTCTKCRQLLPEFEDWCNKNNINYRVVCFDTASDEDKDIIIKEKVCSVPSIIISENASRKAYSVDKGLASVVSAVNEFNAREGV